MNKNKKIWGFHDNGGILFGFGDLNSLLFPLPSDVMAAGKKQQNTQIDDGDWLIRGIMEAGVAIQWINISHSLRQNVVTFTLSHQHLKREYHGTPVFSIGQNSDLYFSCGPRFFSLIQVWLTCPLFQRLKTQLILQGGPTSEPT